LFTVATGSPQLGAATCGSEHLIDLALRGTAASA